MSLYLLIDFTGLEGISLFVFILRKSLINKLLVFVLINKFKFLCNENVN